MISQQGAKWDMSYGEHLTQQEGEMLQHMQIHKYVKCPKHEAWVKMMKIENLRFACGHCTEQDPYRPNGIVRMPKGYYLCKKCTELLERKRLKFVTEVMAVCACCVLEEIYRIQAIDPGKFVDLMPPGTPMDPSPVRPG